MVYFYFVTYFVSLPRHDYNFQKLNYPPPPRGATGKFYAVSKLFKNALKKLNWGARKCEAKSLGLSTRIN